MTVKIIKTVDIVSTSTHDECICSLGGPVCGDGDGLLSGAIRFNGIHWYSISTRNSVEFPMYIDECGWRHLTLSVDDKGCPIAQVVSEGTVPS